MSSVKRRHMHATETGMATSIPVEELGMELNRYRTQRDLSLRAVAEEIDVSASTLSRMENGKVPESKRVIERVASWLGVTVSTGTPDAGRREPRDELRRTMEVYLRAEKNLPEDVARAIADAAESVMEYEARKATPGGEGDG